MMRSDQNCGGGGGGSGGGGSGDNGVGGDVVPLSHTQKTQGLSIGVGEVVNIGIFLLM